MKKTTKAGCMLVLLFVTSYTTLFSQNRLNTSENLNGVAQWNSTNWYVVGTNGFSIFSNDMGKTWNTDTIGVYTNLNRIIASANYSHHRRIAVGDGGFVLYNYSNPASSMSQHYRFPTLPVLYDVSAIYQWYGADLITVGASGFVGMVNNSDELVTPTLNISSDLTAVMLNSGDFSEGFSGSNTITSIDAWIGSQSALYRLLKPTDTSFYHVTTYKLDSLTNGTITSINSRANNLILLGSSTGELLSFDPTVTPLKFVKISTNGGRTGIKSSGINRIVSASLRYNQTVTVAVGNKGRGILYNDGNNAAYDEEATSTSADLYDVMVVQDPVKLIPSSTEPMRYIVCVGINGTFITNDSIGLLPFNLNINGKQANKVSVHDTLSYPSGSANVLFAWQKNATVINGQTGYSFVVPDTATYTLAASAFQDFYILDNNDNPSIQVPFTAISNPYKAINVVTGLLGESEKKGLGVYPNPASDKLYVKSLPGNYYALIDNAGRLIREGNSSELISGLDVTSLPDGFYVLSVSQGNQPMFSKVCIKH